jgi:hypothetical protein
MSTALIADISINDCIERLIAKNAFDATIDTEFGTVKFKKLKIFCKIQRKYILDSTHERKRCNIQITQEEMMEFLNQINQEIFKW